MALWQMIQAKQVFETRRLDAEHFRPDYTRSEYLVNKVGAKPLGQLASYIKRGVQPSYSEEGKIPVLRTVNIREIALSDNRQEWVTTNFFQSNPRGQVYQHDILITSTGVGTLGRVAYNYESTPYFADGHITIVRDIRGIEPLFVATFLQSKIGLALIERRQRGSSGQIEIYPSDIAAIPIPLLQRTFQTEIAHQSQQSRNLIQSSKGLYDQAEQLLLHILGLDQLEISTKTAYTAMFGEAVAANRLDAEYFQPKYRTIIEHLSHNFHADQIGQWGSVLKGRSVKYLDFGTGIPVIRSGDLTDLDHANDLKQAAPNQVFFPLQKGDICISSIGFGSIGKVQVFDNEGVYTTVSEVTVVRQKRVNPYYLQIFLQSVAGQQQIERWITGATGQLHLYPSHVKCIVVPILSTELQTEIERLVMESRKAKREATQLLEVAKQRVEQMILGEAQ